MAMIYVNGFGSHRGAEKVWETILKNDPKRRLDLMVATDRNREMNGGGTVVDWLSFPN